MDFKIDNKLDELEHQLHLCKKTLGHLTSLGETGSELSLVKTKINEAELWLSNHRSMKEAGFNGVC